MSRKNVQPTGRESPFSDHEIIVSKTDLKGRITYANDVFARVSGFSVSELIGQPQSIIRHPDMPRSIFKLLWDTIQSGEEIFAYVVNMARNGDHYWVLAHVTPTFDANRAITGYHSFRRKPRSDQVAAIAPLYKEILKEESRPSNRKDGMHSASEMLGSHLRQKGISYDEFVFSV